MAAEAAITGHLVLSSLHTTRAAAAPVRLIDMGIEPYLVASSLTCVVAQRLIRKICDDCAQPVARADATRLLHDLGAGEAELDIAAMRAPVGCPICRNTGYSGRSAIFEIMPVTEDVARMIVERAPTAEVERLAVAQGMDTLRTAALKRVARGALGVDEMLRVIS
jgi:type IV pilus assembly protein PilB